MNMFWRRKEKVAIESLGMIQKPPVPTKKVKEKPTKT